MLAVCLRSQHHCGTHDESLCFVFFIRIRCSQSSGVTLGMTCSSTAGDKPPTSSSPFTLCADLWLETLGCQIYLLRFPGTQSSHRTSLANSCYLCCRLGAVFCLLVTLGLVWLNMQNLPLLLCNETPFPCSSPSQQGHHPKAK